MRNKILSLLLGIFLSVMSLNVGAQDEINIPIKKDSTVETTLRVKIEHGSIPVRFKNTVEALTQEQINKIIGTLEESKNISVETDMEITKSLSKVNGVFETLNTLLEEEGFMENKTIYQAKRHYDLSESEVKRSLRIKQWIDLLAYVTILIYFFLLVKNVNLKSRANKGWIDLDKLLVSILSFALEVFFIWCIVRPIITIVFNSNYEIIKFLLRSA